MKFYQGVDYFLFFEDFPHMGVPGVIAANSDGTANIYINTLYSLDVQRRALKHELRHLVKGHCFCDSITIREKELDAEDIEDPSCVFSSDFSSVTYYPDLEKKVRKIPLFNSLDAFADFLKSNGLLVN